MAVKNNGNNGNNKSEICARVLQLKCTLSDFSVHPGLVSRIVFSKLLCYMGDLSSDVNTLCVEIVDNP